MKKIICVLFVLVMLVPMVGCSGNKQFDSESAMMEYLNGMWVVDNNREDRTYYIFRDNKIYNISDTVFLGKLEELFDSYISDDHLAELCKLDFATAIDALGAEAILGDCQENVVLQPGKGKVIIDQGMTYEKSIIIADDAVSIKEVNEKVGTTLNKLSDTEDFATAHFESLFNQALDNYQIPSSYFLMDTKEYGEAIKSTISSFDWWSLVQSEGDLQAYKPNEALTPLNGSCLIITKESLTYLYKTSVSTGFIGQNHEELLSLIYNPEKGSCEITTVNTSNMNAHSLIAYCIYATQNIPGAYTDPATLYNDMVAKGETKRTDYDTTITMKSNGLEYSLRITYDEVPADFNVQVDNTISLKQIMDANEKSQGTDAQNTPSQSGTLELLLDGSKSWVGKWALDGWAYNVHFVFKEDGTCYFALSELEVLGAGMGTYSVEDGNTLYLELMEIGKKCSDIYSFDPDTFSLKVISAESFMAKKGDILYLQEDVDNDAEKIEKWGSLYSKAPMESETWE